jgi:oxaloacetate decarboxylase alpha subunit
MSSLREKNNINKIDFVDTSLRDAQQSHWALRMRTSMMYPIAQVMDRVGFKRMDFLAGNVFDACIRFLRENPWERVRLMSKVMPRTPLTFLMMAKKAVGFPAFESSVDLRPLWIKRIAANGIRRIQMYDSSNIVSNMAKPVRLSKAEGLEVIVGLVYSHGTVYSDEYYGQKARDAAKLAPDAIYLKDPAGLLTPERIRTLIPVIQQNVNGIPLELHSHCTTGLAPLCYLEAIRLGVRTVHTAISPLANGPSQPSTENILNNARFLGYTSSLDEEALGAMAAHFRYVARREHLPAGVPVEYDLNQYEHQIPGGVISNLKSQLSDIGMEHRLEEVIEEIIQVRKDMGCPIMVTPYSQFVSNQATINVTVGERYKVVTDDIIKFAMGYHGEQAAPMDQNIKDKILSLPEAKKFSNWQPPQLSLKRLRQEFGSGLSDDEFLLRVSFGEEHIKAMQAAGPIKTEYPKEKPVVSLIQKLMTRTDSDYIRIQKGDFSLTLKK